MTRQQVSERAEQAAIVQLLRTIRAAVYTIGTVRRRDDYPGTMQSPGIADLVAFLPPGVTDGRELQVWIEVKAQRGRLSVAQQIFRAHCDAAGQCYITGGLDAVVSWLQQRGYLAAPVAPRARQSGA